MITASKLNNWYFTKRALPFWVIFIVDSLIIYFSAVFTTMLMSGVARTLAMLGPLSLTILVYLPFYMVGFIIFHTYAGIIRYSSFIDLQRIALAVIFGTVLCIIAKIILGDRFSIYVVRIRDILLWSFSAIVLMWSLRIIGKHIYESLFVISGQTPSFVYGIQKGGISIGKSMRSKEQSKFILAGFVTDDPAYSRHSLMGVSVYFRDDSLIPTMKRLKVKALFISPQHSEQMRNDSEFVNQLIEAGIKIFMVPPEVEFGSDSESDVTHNQLREVQIEDLLPREKITVDMDAIGRLLAGHTILITGAAGSIGSEMVRQIAPYKPESIILVDQAETPLHDMRLLMARQFPYVKSYLYVADISNRSRMHDIFREHRPQYVFHAAAYKHVPMMEDNPSESIHNNILGTKIVADLAVEFDTEKFVMISTDKAVNPTNVMGCSKRICEIYVQSLDKAIKDGRMDGRTQFVTTRFGNVLGSNGSVIPLFREQIRNGGPVTVTHPDIIRYFMLIPEACKLVLEAGTMGHGGEIFVFDMGKPVKIIDLARRMISLSGANVGIKITGLRNGEKLYEEVLNDQEITLPTFHPKIKIARVREYDYTDANCRIQEMVALNYVSDNMAIVRRMKEMVPEYHSQHSVYQILDREAEALAAQESRCQQA